MITSLLIRKERAAGEHSGLSLTYGDAVVAYALPNAGGAM
jgi:hypothetical protein